MIPGTGAEFVVLTGPLGSGKTTLLLDHLATRGASDTGVIVNEAGAINVDGAVLSTGINGLSLANLPNGCICCSQGDDLPGAIDALLAARALREREPIRRIVLECSGLAYPVPILRSLARFRRHAFRVRILSTFDAFGSAPDDAVVPIVAAQLAAAQAVVVTRAEVAGTETLSRAVAAVASFNPLLDPIVVADRTARAVAAFSPGPKANVTRLLADRPDGHPRIQVFQAGWAGPAAWPDVSDWLDGLSGALGERLLRVKGIIDVDGCPEALLIESVGTAFSTPRRLVGQVGAARGLVIIARDVDAAELNALSGGISVQPSIGQAGHGH